MNKKIIKPSILSGFMELLPREQEIFSDILEKIKEVYKENGFLEIDTPILEKQEILLSKEGGETEKEVYRFKKGKKDIVLRFDLTVPFARYVAQHFDYLNFPFKRYQVGKVYRGERNQRGRYREFYQFDIDIIGNEKLNINNDALVISLAFKAFKRIGLNEFEFLLNNKKILVGILEELKIENSKEVLILLDKVEKIEKDVFERELLNLVSLKNYNIINSIINIKGENLEKIDYLESLNLKNETLRTGIKEIKEVLKTLNYLGVDEEKVVLDFKIIRGLDYYTGTIVETVLIGNEKYGSICSGGRYDNLASNFTKRVLPGVGISIGITRLFFVLKEIGFLKNYYIKESLDYLIITITEDIKVALDILKRIQNKGYKAAIYFEEGTLKKKMSYADKLGAKKVILVGEEIKVRDMKKGIYETLDLE
ncbi:MAG: histidine--tRNA ligase [Clostridium chrysemydis]|uniref:histidine--tRNA ligase n=1 Tax=Clostridium chrysemydis TaxID=2665504 RepID=UPI003F3E14BA